MAAAGSESEASVRRPPPAREDGAVRARVHEEGSPYEASSIGGGELREAALTADEPLEGHAWEKGLEVSGGALRHGSLPLV
eukprot:scaffold5876_cov129-Isochrysis_galbana.AAC.8